ncbi:MAG: site-specific DNA-methyltransferase [Planctomycetaceae bacterium]|jgi:adenine-specific DNA-methyltransferase|nr:site-specific DNA-methyltransferase [Planctomycetaceae bacterium]
MNQQNSKKTKSFNGGLKSAIAHNNSIKPNSELLNTLKISVPQFFEKDVYDENGILIKNGAFKIDKFLDDLKENNITESQDGYKLVFAGKDYARLQTGRQSETMIVPDVLHNSQKENENSNNIFITGDNLEALRHLQNAYAGKIKMIYIDPPYNTGKEFIYNDKFEFTDKQLKSALSYGDNGITRLKALHGKSSHSAWLTFMYSRLKFAQKLLTDNGGAIFISIDDNEQASLKLLMDDIFGEENFVAMFNWQTKKAAQGMTTENMIVNNHEYILVYAKQKNKFKFKGMKRNENNGFANPDNDPRGLWKRQYLQRLGQGLPVRTIIDPKTGNKFSFETPYTQEKLNSWIKENRIIFPNSQDKYPARKEFLLEYKNEQQLVTSLGLYPTKSTTEKLYKLFDGNKIFTNPKPDTLLMDLLSYITLSKDDIILDFFAGSGTTAHAILQLNAENFNNLKFILIQLNEPTNPNSDARKAGYNTIDEIARERIKRTAKKIKTEKKLALPKNFDAGFKHYRLVTPDVKMLDKIIEFDPESKRLFEIDMIDQFAYKKTKTTGLETLLTTWLINDGYQFDTKIETKIFDNYKSHYIKKSATLYLINLGWNTKALKILLNEISKNKLIVNTIIVYAYSFDFESMRELKTNIKINLKNPPKIIERY